jgi:outer membrane lipoprotein-sorting protein
MKRQSRLALYGMAVAAVCLLGIALASGQGGPQGSGQNPVPAATAQDKPLMSEQAFKNVQLLRGIPADEFMDTMGMFSAATGMNCVDCHVEDAGGDWAKYADDNDYKRTTRMMIVLMNNLNQSYFGGRRVLTCYSCHNGGRRPRTLPNLVTQYAVAPPAEPDEILQPWPGTPSADQVLDKYVQAVGGAQRLSSLTSIVGKGTYRLYDDFETNPLELYVKSPNQRTTILHSPYGDITTTFDGRNAWMAAPAEIRPIQVTPYTGGNLEGAAVDAKLAFPGRLKQAFTQWVVGPVTVIDDHDVQIVQGNSAPGFPVKLYFDVESGLLLRSVRYSESPVGRVPTQIDYADYRDVSGIKIPFKWTTTWTDGRTVFELTSAQVNTAVDAAKFAKPAAPKPVAVR